MSAALRRPCLAQQRHKAQSGRCTTICVPQQRRCSSSTTLRAQAYDKVRDAMTSGQVYSIGPDDTVEHALEKLVRHRVTGLPVVDASGAVIGVVADSDLLALHTLGRVNVAQEKQMFPEVDVTWSAFTAVKRLLAKSGGKKIRDVMSSNPITVTEDTDLDEAARIILMKRIRRLPVVDGNGRLVGVLSRGNLVKAALALRTAAGAS